MKSAFISALRAGSATIVIGFTLIAAPAFAQDAPGNPAAADKNQPAPSGNQRPAPDTKLADSSNTSADVIIVTGSIVRNASAATASPVTSLTGTELANRGFTTIADAVQSLPANNAGTDPTNWTAMGGFATGASSISLRGFNDSYTLTLFNDLRTAYYPLADDGYRTIVDINTIPDAIVDRVDVLQDGASSTYGSDAVAGVVNIIVKKEITGLHLDASDGISQQGDGSEHRITGTVGFGKLSENGYNFYVNGEYQKNAAVFLNQRGAPYGTANQSTICNAAGSCETNGILNGIQAGGGYNGFQETAVGYAAAFDPVAGTTTGRYQLINPAAGCQGLASTTLSQTILGSATGATAPANGVVCQQDTVAQYGDYSPAVERIGGTAHFTANVGANAQFYAMANFYQVKTASVTTAPRAFDYNTAAGGTQVYLQGHVLLPVYVCPGGVGGIDANGYTTSTCTASSAGAKLNPNNPFAASGQEAQLSQNYNRPETVLSDTKTYRFAAGLSGSFGKDWNYDVEGTTSWIDLNVTSENYINAQHLLNLIATGGYNFADPGANSQATLDYLAPTVVQKTSSKLSQFQGTLNKNIFSLQGGMFNIAIGGAYRFESVNDPSANPANDTNPLDRYFDINSVSVKGSRRVYSGFYEITAPVFTGLTLKADGRYDAYSVGGKNFSPKFEGEFQVVKQLKLRGTYAQGFHVASFSELFAAPTTGYVNAQINCATAAAQYPAFCAAHASNPAYYNGAAGQGYSYGLTSAGNTNLKPEKSESYTLGMVFTPERHLTLTVDYWHTKISNIIVGVTPTQAVFDQYYQNNGVVNIPGITVTKGAPDPQNPTALPLIGQVIGSYANALSEVGSGVDITANLRYPLNSSGLRLISSFNASYLAKLNERQQDGSVQAYAGTLSPCNITSCSGAPRWRGVWSNTLDFNGKGSVTLTGNYTSGYLAIPQDISFTVTYPDGSLVQERVNATFDLDLTASVKVADHFTLYGNVLDLLNSRPPFDPTAGYSLYQFNPAWADKNFMGRYFRVGVKYDF